MSESGEGLEPATFKSWGGTIVESVKSICFVPFEIVQVFAQAVWNLSAAADACYNTACDVA